MSSLEQTLNILPQILEFAVAVVGQPGPIYVDTGVIAHARLKGYPTSKNMQAFEGDIIEISASNKSKGHDNLITLEDVVRAFNEYTPPRKAEDGDRSFSFEGIVKVKKDKGHTGHTDSDVRLVDRVGQLTTQCMQSVQ
jgi:hypothetical protein